MIRQLFKILFILFLFPGHILAQSNTSVETDLTGLWKGSLYNDTTKKTLPYQLAISEENGKLSGYSYTLFDIDGKKELGVKKIKIKRKDNQLIIEDVELISNDYSAPPPKKVRQQSVVNLLMNDTSMQLTGKWSTNPTREYRPLTGSLQLTRALDFKPLVLFKILVQLKLDQGLSFVQADNMRNAELTLNEKKFAETKLAVPIPSQVPDADKPVIIIVAAAEKKIEVKQADTSLHNLIESSVVPVTIVHVNKPVDIVDPAPMKKTSFVIAPGLVPKAEKKASLQPVVKISNKHVPVNMITPKSYQPIVAINDSKKINVQPAVEIPKPIFVQAAPKKAETVINKEPIKKEIKPIIIVKKPAVVEKPKASPAPINNEKTTLPAAINAPVKNPIQPGISTQPKKELIAAVATAPVQAAAANVAERKMNNQQGVYFESDSLVLTLYDNGEVDGDTVSVLMNGQVIFSRQGLTTKANSKTIYIDKGMPDTLSMVMYAENLGSIPPNTGLLIIMDGEKRYEVRFSADLKTNAAILLRRRKTAK